MYSAILFKPEFAVCIVDIYIISKLKGIKMVLKNVVISTNPSWLCHDSQYWKSFGNDVA